MEIQLVSTKIQNLQFKAINNEYGGDGQVIHLEFNTIFLEDKVDMFANKFILKVNQPNNYSFDLEFLAFFKASEKITEEFRQSEFTRINSPAIAFPFLRNYVSNFILNSGFQPLILPTINFIKLEATKKVNSGA